MYMYPGNGELYWISFHLWLTWLEVCVVREEEPTIVQTNGDSIQSVPRLTDHAANQERPQLRDSSPLWSNALAALHC